MKRGGRAENVSVCHPPHTRMNTRLTPTRIVTDQITNEKSHDHPARGSIPVNEPLNIVTLCLRRVPYEDEVVNTRSDTVQSILLSRHDQLFYQILVAYYCNTNISFQLFIPTACGLLHGASTLVIQCTCHPFKRQSRLILVWLTIFLSD